jgi:hypothetical protein
MKSSMTEIILQNINYIVKATFYKGLFDYVFNLFLILLIFVDVWEVKMTSFARRGTVKNLEKEEFVKQVSVIIFFGYLVLFLSKFFENIFLFIVLLFFILYLSVKFYKEGIIKELLHFVLNKIKK